MKILNVLSAIAVCANAVAQETAGPATSELRLRNRIEVVSDVVSLGDVINFAGANAKLQAELETKRLFKADEPAGEFDVSHEQVMKRLVELGVNPGHITLSGARVCHVTHGQRPTLAATEGRNAARPARDAPEMGAETSDATLEAALRRWIENDVRELGGRCEIQFEAAGREFLELSSPEYEFAIRASSSGAKLGLRELSVTIRRDGRTQRTLRIAASVKLTKDVLIAIRPLSVGAFVRREDLRPEERLFSRDADLGIDRIEAIVGQQVRTFVEAGSMVTERQLQTVELVKRSSPVTVIGNSGAVQLRMTGMARDNGRLGDKVRVRLGESRSDQREVFGVVTGPGSVRIVSDGVACAGGGK
ncbi:MAG: flagellar basal body P-ring formation protein FlgA [Phycisphaerales bacterium]|nr:flagellar basal body P-ring formation protein FlgA [Phycisphaerales bacterium]